MRRSLSIQALISALCALAPLAAQERYGAGTPGTGGVTPEIWFRGTAYPGNPAFQLELEAAIGGATTLLAVGGGRTSQSVLGIELLVQPWFAIQPGLTSGVPGSAGAGSLSLPLPLPNDPSLISLRLDLQWIVVDPAGPVGLAASAGLEVQVGQPPLVLACGSERSLDPVYAIDLVAGSVSDWAGRAGVNNPADLQFTPDGRLVVIASSLGRQFVIADATQGGARLAALSVPGLPNSAAITPDGRRAYGITGGTQGSGLGRIYEIDLDPASPSFGQQIGVVTGVPATADQLEGVGISGDGLTMTVANLGLGQSSWIMDVDIDPQSPAFNTVRNVMGAPGMVTDIEPNADGSFAFATIASLGGLGDLLVIHLPTWTVVRIEQGIGAFPTDIDLGPRGRYAFIACPNSNEVVRVTVDLQDPTFGARLATPGNLAGPFAVAVSADGGIVWSTQQTGQGVDAIDAATMTLLYSIPVGPAGAAGIAVR